MTYEQTLEFLYSQLPAYHRIGKAAYKNSLDNTLSLDEYFDHPHLKYKTIHVAGTNGKGSVSHMLASILQEAGYKTGLYTSPHLKDFRERIKVDGRMMPKSKVTSFIRKHKEIIDSLHPSFFELTVAMAFQHFREENIDVAVVEVGLGGRLDSTNIINPVLSVITNIGHDHMDLLGDTIEKVAFEKAGIIKRNIPVVIGETQKETKNIFISRASQLKSEIFFADQKFTCNLEDSFIVSVERKFTISDQTTGNVFNGIIPLGGDYQVKNLQTVFQSFISLEKEFSLSETDLIRGIRNVVVNTGLNGRWQIIGRSPLVVCDTGHNKEGLEYVLRQLMKIPCGTLRMVIGFVSDKDLTSILPYFPMHAKYYFTRASVPRALDEKILQSKASDYSLKGTSCSNVRMALEKAKSDAEHDDVIFVGGSTFVVAEVI